MTEALGSYPEIKRQLQREVARGKEAEKLLGLGDETFPKETLNDLITKGRHAQVRLDKLKPRQKYYTEEYPSGPWSRALYQIRTGKPFKEEEFRVIAQKEKATPKEVEQN